MLDSLVPIKLLLLIRHNRENEDRAEIVRRDLELSRPDLSSLMERRQSCTEGMRAKPPSISKLTSY